MMTVRTALLLTVSVMTGILVGVLTHGAGAPWQAAAVAGITAAGATLVGAHQLVK